MRCAMVNTETREVVNFIEADPVRDLAPKGFELAPGPDDPAVGPGWLYSRDRGYIMGAALKAQIEAQATAFRNSPEGQQYFLAREKPDDFLTMMMGAE